MRALNVEPPTTLTRVTEHMSDINQYINQIQANGFAYQVEDGSIYFDTKRLGPQYGKLMEQNDWSDDTNDGELRR